VCRRARRARRARDAQPHPSPRRGWTSGSRCVSSRSSRSPRSRRAAAPEPAVAAQSVRAVLLVVADPLAARAAVNLGE
jgi:hypothetical protein